MHTPRAPLALIAAAVILALLLIGAVLLGIAYALHTLDERYPIVADTILIALPLGAAVFSVCSLALLALGMYNRWAGHAPARADKQIRMVQADRQVAPLATTFHYAIQPAALPPPADLLQLDAPIPVVKSLDVWMQWADEQPHILLAGKTKAGKTHLATALLERRLRAGERVFIIDPHSSGWLKLPTAGSVANPNELKYALVALLAEYTRRMQERENFKKTHDGAELPHDHFGRMTVLIDEANEIAGQISTIWNAFATQFASGSRKVGIALLLLAQSPNVEDIGFNAKMRANFAAIALDVTSVQYLIDHERDKPRKIALRDAAHDMEYPAAALIGADVWLLDRSNLPAGHAPQAALSLMWGGWDYTQGRAVSSLSGDSALPPTTRIGNSVPNVEPAPGADSSNSSSVPLTPAEIARIAQLLVGNTPSEAAKKLDGFHPRKYAEYKAKVDTVIALMSEVNP